VARWDRFGAHHPRRTYLDDERDIAWIERADQYVRETNAKIVSAIGEALKRLEPARLSYTHARCGFAMNRRCVTAAGVRNGTNPDGPVDHCVPVLRVDSIDNKVLRAVVFGCACHNTVLSTYDLNGDYAGWAQHFLQEAQPILESTRIGGILRSLGHRIQERPSGGRGVVYMC